MATDLPLAWTVQPANEQEQHFAVRLIDKARARGFEPQTASMDKGYDTAEVHMWCRVRDVAPVIPLRETKGVKLGKAEPPHCVHGEWTFAGADYKRKATKWRCPTGECEPKSIWVDATREHPLIPRNTKRYWQLYRQRSSVEREFGRLKHEWSLLPLRVRGRAQVQLHADLTILATLACALAKARSASTAIAA